MNLFDFRDRFLPVSKGNVFEMEGWWVWGSSVVLGDDGKYHMFVSRVPKCLPFHPGWMIASEIVRAVSDVPEGPYKFQEVVLKSRGAEYWDGRSAHNPKIIKHGNKYLLYYMGSTHPFEDVENPIDLTIDSKWCIVGRSNKRIGLAISDSVLGPWERMDHPILDTKPQTYYSFLTSNPAPAVDSVGKIYLIFKSRRYVGHRHGEMSIGLATAPHYSGPYSVVSSEPLFSENSFGVIEDPFLWIDESGFHLLAKDQHAKIGGEVGGGVVFHSDDCLNWRTRKDPRAYSKEIIWDDGSRRVFGNMERCSCLFDTKGKISHLYFAIWEGEGGFCNPSVNDRAYNLCIQLRDDS